MLLEDLVREFTAMMIFQSRKIIFIHLHKCGGSSIELSLAPLAKWNDIIIDGTEENKIRQTMYHKLFGFHKHSSAQSVWDVVGEEFWNSANTFSSVRSPYGRLASLYSYAAWLNAQIAANPEVAEAAASFPAVRAYVSAQSALHPFSAFLRSRTLIEEEPAYLPQFNQLADRSNRLLVRCVFKLETLSRGWSECCEVLKVPFLPLVSTNVTPKRFSRPFHELVASRADIDLINERFGNDFESFQYQRL